MDMDDFHFYKGEVQALYIYFIGKTDSYALKYFLLDSTSEVKPLWPKNGPLLKTFGLIERKTALLYAIFRALGENNYIT